MTPAGYVNEGPVSLLTLTISVLYMGYWCD